MVAQKTKWFAVLIKSDNLHNYETNPQHDGQIESSILQTVSHTEQLSSVGKADAISAHFMKQLEFARVSRELYSLLLACLRCEPELRPSLGELIRRTHDKHFCWFVTSVQESRAQLSSSINAKDLADLSLSLRTSLSFSSMDVDDIASLLPRSSICTESPGDRDARSQVKYEDDLVTRLASLDAGLDARCSRGSYSSTSFSSERIFNSAVLDSIGSIVSDAECEQRVAPAVQSGPNVVSNVADGDCIQEESRVTSVQGPPVQSGSPQVVAEGVAVPSNE